MKKTTVAFLMLLVAVPLQAQNSTSKTEASKTFGDLKLPFYVYRAFKAPDNHYVPSGWMGDHGDIKFDDKFKDPKDNQSVIRVTYTAAGSQNNGWAGVYWQNPANNWGSREGGYNLNGAKRVTFRARGEKGGETISQFKVGGIQGHFSDSGSAAIGPIALAKEWKQYEIALDGQELSSISGGFCWTMTRDQNPEGAVFYLDDIRYE